MLSKRIKQNIAKKFGKHPDDTGSAEVQVGTLTRRIQELSDHLKKNPKDKHSRRGLLQMVNKRRKLLSYLKREDMEAYERVEKEIK